MQVVANDITAIANLLEVGYNATLATPALNTKQAVTVFNSFVVVGAHSLFPSHSQKTNKQKMKANEYLTLNLPSLPRHK